MKKIAMALFILAIPALALAIIGQGFDNEGPIVTIISPTDNQSFAYGTTSAYLSYSAEDFGGGSVTKYWVKKDSNAWIDNSLNADYNFTGLSAGSHTFYVIATDDSDNNSDATPVDFTIVSESCGNEVCEPTLGETCTSCSLDCGECLLETCATKEEPVCTSSQKCSGSTEVLGAETCCIGSCVEKTCIDYGGTTCSEGYTCSSWLDQSMDCCNADSCIPIPLEHTILCSFPTYLENEPLTSIFVELSKLGTSYDFNVAGKTRTINPNPSNTLADVIVTQYGAVFVISSTDFNSPNFTPDRAYLLELLKNDKLYGTASYSGSAENYQQIYSLISSSRLRWWNAENDDTCEPKLKPSDLGVSLQTMHYFRINNLWMLWNDLSKKK